MSKNNEEFTLSNAWKKSLMYLAGFLFFTGLIGFSLHHIITFNQETLLWTATTIIQAFGAMIAIIIAIILYKLPSVENLFEEIFKTSLGIAEGEDSKVVDVDKALKKVKDASKKSISPLQKMVGPPIISIALLIIVAFLILFFTKSTLKFSFQFDINILIAVAMTFLVLYSIFCIALLTTKILELINKV